MTSRPGDNLGAWRSLAIVAAVLILALTPAGAGLGQRFFSSLRIDKPERVTVTLPTTPGSSGIASSRTWSAA